jgi:hypothetical protein
LMEGNRVIRQEWLSIDHRCERTFKIANGTSIGCGQKAKSDSRVSLGGSEVLSLTIASCDTADPVVQCGGSDLVKQDIKLVRLSSIQFIVSTQFSSVKEKESLYPAKTTSFVRPADRSVITPSLMIEKPRR